MSYDSRLDNCHRQVGDRIVSERDHQTEQAIGAIYDLLPVHPRLQLLVGILAAIAAAVLEIQANNGHWTEGYVLLAILGALVAGILGAMFSLFVLYGGAAALAYRSTGSITLTIIVPVGLAYIGHKWEVIASSMRKARIDGTRPIAGHVGRPVRIFASTVLGTLAAILLIFILCAPKRESAPAAQPTAVVAQAPPPSVAFVKASGVASHVDHHAGETFGAGTTPAEAAVPVAPMSTNGSGVNLASASIGELVAAIDHGNVEAETELGVRYLNGRGVTKDYKSAIAHFQAAAGEGDLRAATNLGWMTTLGQGVARDDAKALELFNVAASKGYANAQDSLGYMYEHGRGVPVDMDIAAGLYRKAADQGSQKSIANLQRLSIQQ